MSSSQTFSLSSEQQAILQAEGNIVVVAGAGTGKTETLTQRVLHLLETGDDNAEAALALHEFIALTFTDKAAGEMRQRIYQSLLRKLVAATDESERARWRVLCAGFAENNRIGTFDSFNQRLLAAYPEYQVAPSHFVAMSAYDERELDVRLRRAFWHWVESFGSDNSLREDVFALLEVFDRKQLTQLVSELAGEEELELNKLAEPINAQDFERELQAIAAQASLRIERRGKRRLHLLWNQWENSLRKQFELPPTLHSILLNEEETQARLDEIFTKETTFRKKWIALEWKELCAEIEARALPFLKVWREANSELQEQLSALRATETSAELDWRSHLVLGAAARLAKWWSTQRQDFCRSEGWLSFRDAHRAALSLLENHPEVAARLRSGNRYLMVDEFQDTNFAQWRLVNAIRAENNVMLIGDGKQSIYGFRGGDITVFDEVRAFHLSAYVTHSLSVSQRATPNLTSFFNAVFQNVLPAEEAEREAWEAPFQELHSAREEVSESGVTVLKATAKSPIVSSQDGEPQSDENGNRELFYAPDESVWPLITRGQSDAESLAETTALFLREIQDDADAIKLRQEDHELLQPRYERIARLMASDQPGAIGILFRTHDRKAMFENALRNQGVRYASVKGVGFFQSQPVFDAINMLRFLFDAHDSLALAGVLRSTIVGASDLALLELRRVQTIQSGQSLWAALQRRFDEESQPEYSLAEEDERALGDGCKRLKNWREKAKIQLISAVLEAVWNESEIAFSEALQSDGIQRRQNWRKILDIIRAREEQGRGGARALSEYFMAQAADEEREADAELPEGGSIQLMTVFAAKGLGFDMTIVAQMDGTFRLDTPLWRKGSLENRDEVLYAVKLNDEDGNSQKSLLWTILASEDRARTEAEFARLFYVACTRARDFLVLAMPSEIGKASWAEMANPLLGDKKIVALHDLRERDHLTSQVSAVDSALPNSLLEPQVNAALLETLPTELGTETSVTQLLKFEEQKLVSVLRSTPDVKSSTLEKMRQAMHDPRLHGEIFHRLLRVTLEKKTLNAFEIDEETIAGLCRSSGLPLTRVPILMRQIAAAVHWLQSQSFDFSQARSEAGFSIPAEIAFEKSSLQLSKTQWLNGVIDLLIPNDKGWAIVDFKTHNGDERLETVIAKRRCDEQVRLYRKACEYSELPIANAWLIFLDEAGKLSVHQV